jgi:UDP-N-acetylmuramoylalanine--D-glutamate ligase
MNKKEILIKKLFENNNKVVIWGYGRTGKTVLKFLYKNTKNIFYVIDKNFIENKSLNTETLNVNFIQESDKISVLTLCDIIIPSPGVIISKDDFFYNKVVAELDIFYYLFKKPIIAITGSIGKTSTTFLYYQLINNLNKVLLGGNIGIPTFDLIENKNNCDFAILEVSDAQLEHSNIFTAEFIAITNIYENHLDRHKNFLNYINSKINILRNKVSLGLEKSGFLILNNETYKKIKEIYIDIDLFNIILCHENEIKYNEIKNEIIYNNFENIFVENNAIFIRKNNKNIKILNIIPEISHKNNWITISALFYAVFKLEKNKELNEILTNNYNNLKIPEHRLEFCGKIKECFFYNDSKSTIMESTESSINQIKDKHKNKKIILLLSGLSKGVDRTIFLLKFSKLVDKIIFFGKEKNIFEKFSLKNNLNISTFEYIEDAMTFVFNNLEPDSVILFSPSGASFDLFNSYEERGKKFKEIINREN